MREIVLMWEAISKIGYFGICSGEMGKKRPALTAGLIRRGYYAPGCFEPMS